MKLRLAAPDHLVDIRRIKELNYVKVSPDLRHRGNESRITTSNRRDAASLCPLLAKTAACIGDVQVRNMEPSAAALPMPTLGRLSWPRSSLSKPRRLASARGTHPPYLGVLPRFIYHRH